MDQETRSPFIEPTALREQELRFEQRYDDLIARLHEARAESAVLRGQFAQTRSKAEEINLAILELRSKLKIKQDVIRQLLPFYPHPITSEFRWQIDC